MLYLLGSFYDMDTNTLAGIRLINVTADGEVGESFDITKSDVLKLLDEGKIEIAKIKNEEELEKWAKYSSIFDVKTGNLVNEVKYVKLTDKKYADCLGKVYNVRNMAELDNFAMNHVFTHLDEEENNEDKNLMNKKTVKKTKSDEEILYKDVCGIGKYSEIQKLTEKYKENVYYGEEVISQLLDIDKVGRFVYNISDKKDGKVVPCVSNTTGLYGVCCLYENNIWILLEPIYKQIETVQSNTTTYIAGLTEEDKWEFIDLKKNLKSDLFIDWFSINNLCGKSGKLFVATTGNKNTGYEWHLMGKNLKLDRQIGCLMLLTDALFMRGRGYTKLVNTVEFYDPRHGETISVNMKDYSMDSMINFRRAFQNTTEKQENEEVVLFYNLICDATSGEIKFQTDKNHIDYSLYFIDINTEFITSLSLFLGTTPKDVSLEIKVKRHLEARHQYIYQKLPVDTTLKLKQLLSMFASYSSAKLLGNYWTFRKIDTIDKAIEDLELEKFIPISKCNDDKDLYFKGYIVCYIDKSVDLISFVRRYGKTIRIDYNNLLGINGEYTEDSQSSIGMADFVSPTLKDTMIYEINIKEITKLSQNKEVYTKPTFDIIQKYKKNKLTIKSTNYVNVVSLKLNINFKGLITEEDYNIYIKLYDGLHFKTSEVEMKKLAVDGSERKIDDVREHAKAYSKILNENQPVLSGFHQSAFKYEIY